MQTAKPLTLALLVLASAACHRDAQPPTPAVATATATATVDLAKPWSVHDWPLPSTTGSGQPDLAVTPDGRVMLSWISSLPGRRKALQFVAMADNGHWYSAPRTIAVGNSLMANWANVPHIAQTADGALWVQFMQQHGEGHAGDVALSRSTDGGFNWSAPIAVNDDGVEAEHGFAALWPATRDSIGVAWLNGGESGDKGMQHGDADMADGEGMHHGEGRTGLHAAVFGKMEFLLGCRIHSGEVAPDDVALVEHGGFQLGIGTRPSHALPQGLQRPPLQQVAADRLRSHEESRKDHKRKPKQ